MGFAEGGEKPGLHLKDKFFGQARRLKMGAWNIITRQIGQDLLGAITDPQLNRADIRGSIRRLAHAQSVRQSLETCL